MAWNKNLILLIAIIALALSIAFFSWVYNLSLPGQSSNSGTQTNVGKVILNVVGTPTADAAEQSPADVCNSLDPAYKQDCLNALAEGNNATTQEAACKLLPADLQQDCLNSLTP